MGEPRWTVDEDGIIRWDRGFFLHPSALAPRRGSYDALVVAVHDAEEHKDCLTVVHEQEEDLAQAQSLIAAMRPWLVEETPQRVLDLLSPAPDEEGTG